MEIINNKSIEIPFYIGNLKIINNKERKRNIISEFNDNNNPSTKRIIIRQNKNGEEDDNISNPIKRRSKSKKNLENNNTKFPYNKGRNEKNNKNNNINNKITKIASRNEQTIIANKKHYPYGMNENEIYDIFSKIYNKTDSELNDLDYKKAIQSDYRTYCLYYVSLIRTNHLFFFSFWPRFDYNSRILKIFLFFFNFAVSFSVNSLFFNDETMHQIYEEKGAFNFIYNLPQILYSSLISGFINGAITVLATIDSNIIELKEKSNKKNVHIMKKNLLSKIKIKIVFFFIISLIFLSAFWIYLACFCYVYKNTQIHLITDTFFSFGTSMISPFIVSILPGLFRINALQAKKKDRGCMFKLSKALQLL